MGLMYDNLLMTLMSGTNAPVDYSEPFYLENPNNSDITVSLVKLQNTQGVTPTLTIETSTDRTTWSIFGTTSTTALNIPVLANSKTYIRCTANTWGHSWADCTNTFSTATGNFNVGGNIMSLLFGNTFNGNELNFPTQNATFIFSRLFQGNEYLVSASKLILRAMILNESCYDLMFFGCNLVNPPALPALALAPSCYRQMFSGCYSLTTAPVLPATTLANGCYSSMFSECIALTTAPALPATTLTPYCYSLMFDRCTSLTTAPALPATTLENYCYSSMFSHCTSLTTAPALPATTLTPYCYMVMFDDCPSLNNVTCLATNISASDCTTAWLRGVSATGTFKKNSSMSGWASGNNGIPTGWTVQNA